jgi:Putative Flp pilus-assembly TadE/G-like
MILSFIGLSVDAGRLYSTRSKMQAAADAGALAASRSSKFGSADPIEMGRAYIGANLLNLGLNVTKLEVGLRPATRDYRVAIEVSYPVMFGGFLGSPTTLPIRVEAIAIGRPPVHTEINVLVDVSGSMGIAATPEGIAKLKQKTKWITDLSPNTVAENGCAFACHWAATWQAPGTPTTFQVAQDNDIKLRWDVSKDAVGRLADILLEPRGSSDPGAAKIGVYGFSEYLETLILPSTDKHRVKSSLDRVTQFNANTFLEKITPELATKIGTGGTGDTAASPAKYLVIATDGVVNSPTRGPHTPTPALCSTYKAQNGGSRLYSLCQR